MDLSSGLTFSLGHVDRVYTDATDVHFAGINELGTKIQPQIVEFYSYEGTSRNRTKVSAQPLLRGINDSVASGDLIMYCTINNINFYLGPINTFNVPGFSSDFLDVVKNPNLLPGNAKLTKPRKTKLDFPNGKIIDGEISQNNPSYIKAQYSDLTLEGRYGNSIRLGARSNNPNIIISNNSTTTEESISGGGSIISMTSLGTMSDMLGIPENTKLSYDGNVFVGRANPNNSGSFTPYLGYELDYNYQYGEIKSEENIEEQELDQIIIGSDKITFNSAHEDITLSSTRNVRIGAVENIELYNKGYSVFESRNIYIGRKAKDRSQPMVLGEELRQLLYRVLKVIGSAHSVDSNFVSQKLSNGPGMPGTVEAEIKSIMTAFNLGDYNLDRNPPAGYNPNLSDGEPVGDRSTGNATFMSQHHFIETNRE